MSKGDNLTGKETYYKKIKLKSVLESRFAFFLDCLDIKWEYEPKKFLLSNNVIYIPDFYLPELKMWIEVKGDIKEHNQTLSSIFCEDNQCELILISNEKLNYYHFDLGQINDGDFIPLLTEENDCLIGKCSKCGSYFFCPSTGSWHCRKCNAHEGDHDLKYSLQCDFYSDDKIDFYDFESIKRGLENYGVSISKF